MSQDQSREEKAFEALIVDTVRRIDRQDLCIDDIREPNETETAALKLLGDDFIDRLVAGKIDRNAAAEKDVDELAMAGDIGGTSLFRCDGVDDAVKEELEKADQQIIERKKRERNDEAS